MARTARPRTKARAAQPSSRRAGHPIVVVGGSAGALGALHRFFGALVRGTTATFLVVVHRTPGAPELLPELIAQYTPLPVKVPAAREELAPGTIYVIPSDRRIAFEDRHLTLGPRRRSHHSIDAALSAVARAAGRDAVGVLLSGMNDDGTAGLKAVRATQGRALVQDPETAEYGVMPRSAVDAGVATTVGAPEDLAAALADAHARTAKRDAVEGDAVEGDAVEGDAVEGDAVEGDAVSAIEAGGRHRGEPAGAMKPKPERRQEALDAELNLHREELLAQNEELRRANAELTAARARLAVIFDAAPTGYAALDGQGRIVQANRALAELVGADVSALVGAMFEGAVHDADRARLRRFIGDLGAVGGPTSCDVTLAREGGPVVHVVGTALAASADDGVRIILALFDDSERRRLQEQRDAAEARLAELSRLESLALMAGGVAHDFNNLLAVVLTQLTFVRMDAPVGSAAETAASQAIEAAERAAALARQLLVYTGRGRVVLRPVDLREVVTGIEGVLRSSVAGRGTVEVALSEGPLVTNGDETQLHQVLMNLVLNAAEAMITPGVIKVEAHGEPDRVVVEVVDSGPGMDAATTRRAFDPFFSTKSFGRGLGLSVVQGHVKAHGGTIEVDSAPGRGTTFRLVLPAIASPAMAAAASKARGLVLLVDDEPLVRAALGAMLRRLGFDVVEACDGDEALEVLPRIDGPVAAILLDVVMPRMNGAATMAALRARGGCPPVVLMSGYSRDDVARTAGGAAQEADAFLEKPFAMRDLDAALRQVMSPPAEAPPRS